ncbi:MAG: magnesium transporter [Candidatus Aenigmarchaeota archaeon]|nr:magnesium transporter [Candidatus Aenigmarchaeota archaeon]
MGTTITKSKLNPGLAEKYITKKVPVVPPNFTIRDTLEYIKDHIREFDSLDYVYVVENSKLEGVFSMRMLYSLNPRSKIENICKVPEIVKVGPNNRAVFAAYLSLKNKISSVPVVNDDGTFLGIIAKESILSILHKKHLEDKFVQAGIHRRHTEFEDVINVPIFETIKFRLLWLFVGLIGGLLAAGIVNYFEQTLSQNIMLAAFIPLVVYIADAVGTQLEAFSIRDFALHQRLDFSKYFMKQSLIVMIIATFLGITSLALCLILFGTFVIAVIIGISIVCATLSSVFTGLFIPFSFRKFKKDPASGSGPIGTIIQDILSVTIYFFIATLLL